jgi:hypothetical protein
MFRLLTIFEKAKYQPSPCFHSTEAYNKFKTNQVKILVTTDVCARGVDVAKVNIVINYDFPSSHEDKDPSASAAATPQDPVSIAADTYLHRVGRAGRFGNRGLAVSFLSSELDRKVWPPAFCCTQTFLFIVIRISLTFRFLIACKRASRPRSKNCPKKSTLLHICLPPELPVVPSFWDRFNFMLSLLEKQVTALMNLHPKLLPPPVRSKFKDFGVLWT